MSVKNIVFEYGLEIVPFQNRDLDRNILMDLKIPVTGTFIIQQRLCQLLLAAPDRGLQEIPGSVLFAFVTITVCFRSILESMFPVSYLHPTKSGSVYPVQTAYLSPGVNHTTS